MSPSKPWKERVGDRIMNARVRAKLSYEELASRCDVSAMTVRRWENGDNSPKASELHAISKATGNTSVDWLLFGVDHAGARQPKNEPVYRGQWRSAPTLERDLATELARRAGGPVDPADIDVGALIDDGARELAAWAQEFERYAQNVVAVTYGLSAVVKGLRVAQTGIGVELRGTQQEIDGLEELSNVLNRLLDEAAPSSRLVRTHFAKHSAP